MGTNNAPEWYIDAGGPKRGPYSIQQIEQFYRNGQVGIDTVLYSTHDPQNPTTVKSLLDLSAAGLPARPAVDLNKPILAPGEEAPPDATLSLFLTLQSTKKKAAADSNVDRTTQETRFSETQLWFAGAMVLIVGTLIWGTTKLLNYSNELGTKSEQPEAKPVPVTHIAPPPPQVEHAPSVPGAAQPKKNLSDYLPKTTQIAPPPSRTAVAPPPLRTSDRERQRIRDRELEMERERQRQRDLEYERERDRELDDERGGDLKKKILGDPYDNDAGVLQQAPIPAPPPPPADPDAPLID